MKGNAIEPFQEKFNKNLESDVIPDAVTINYSVILLLNKIEALKEVYHEEKYIHEKTIKNFLFYLDRIKSEKDKQVVYEHVHQFLSKLELKHYSNPFEVVVLYKMHLEQLGRYYAKFFSFKVAKRKTHFLLLLNASNKVSKRRYGLFY